MTRVLIGCIAAALLAFASHSPAAQEAQQARAALVLTIDGAIGPATAEYVHEGLAEAARRQAPVVVLRMDTPGGLSSSMREIIRDILASPVPVIAYVSPTGARAASAGTYIFYAAHVAAMAPSTTLGAATPVQIGGSPFGRDTKDDDKKDAKTTTPEANKAVNDAAAYIRGLAQLRGRNAQWAEQAVREAATLTASEAKDRQVADLIAGDLADLLRMTDGRSVRSGDRDIVLATRGLATVAYAPDWRTALLAAITNPNVAYILLLVGIYGLLFEFINPGALFPGVIGGIALLVGLYALNLMPVNYAGVALLLLGMAMMIAEAFIPSFGALGLGGIAAFIIGSLFLFRGDVPGFQIDWPVIAASAIVSLGFLVLAIAVSWRAYRRRVAIGDPALIGAAGKVTVWSGDAGEIHAMGERWHAVSSTSLVPGQRVRIVERRDLTLVVEPETATAPQR